jgi:RNA polymerase-binding transcription factor DksA
VVDKFKIVTYTIHMDTTHFKTILSAKKDELESRLKTVGRQNPTNTGDWEAVEPENGRDRADETEVALGIEEFETNTAIVHQLEIELRAVTNALEKISSGTFGTCEVCGKEIEHDRLEAEPYAPTCEEHMK